MVSAAVSALFRADSRDYGSRFRAVRLTARSPKTVLDAATRIVAKSFCGTASTPPDPSYEWVYTCSTQRLLEPLAESPSPKRQAWFDWIARTSIVWALEHASVYGLYLKESDGEEVLVAAAVAQAPDAPELDLSLTAQLRILWKGGIPPWHTGSPAGFFELWGRVAHLEKTFKGMHDEIRAAHGSNLHIMILGCDPERQGQGCGSALLKLLLEIADADGVPAYLETVGCRNEGFYAKKGGFRVVQRAVVTSKRGDALDIDGGAAAMVRPAGGAEEPKPVM